MTTGEVQVGIDKPDSVTHFICPEKPGFTHHLVPTGPSAARVHRCTTCRWTEAELRERHGLP